MKEFRTKNGNLSAPSNVTGANLNRTGREGGGRLEFDRGRFMHAHHEGLVLGTRREGLFFEPFPFPLSSVNAVIFKGSETGIKFVFDTNQI